MGTFKLYDSIREIVERVALFQRLTPSQLEKMLKRAGIADRRPVKESALACRDLATSFSTMLSFFESLSTMEPVLSELRMAELRYAALLVLVYLVRADGLATKTGNGDYRAITSMLLLNMAIRDLLSEDEIFAEWYIAHASREQGEILLARTCEVSVFLSHCLSSTLAQAMQELEKGMSRSLKDCRDCASTNLDILDHDTQQLTFDPHVTEPLLKTWVSLTPSEQLQRYKTIPDVAMKRADLMHRVRLYDMLNDMMKQILNSPVFTVVLPQGGAITIKKGPV